MDHSYEDNLFGILEALDMVLNRVIESELSKPDTCEEEIDDANVVADVEYKEVI